MTITHDEILVFEDEEDLEFESNVTWTKINWYKTNGLFETIKIIISPCVLVKVQMG